MDKKITSEQAIEIFVNYYKDLNSLKDLSIKYSVKRHVVNCIIGRMTFKKETEPFLYLMSNRQKKDIKDLENEIWIDIINFEDQYQISNFGRVKSLERIDTKGQIRYQKILSSRQDKGGYLRVVLCQNSKMYNFIVHRLVAIHFLITPENYKDLTVNHKDGNKLNNHPSNLEWLTIADNNKHAYMTGLKDNKGEKHGEAKLTEKQVLNIRYLNKIKWFNQKELAHIFGVSKTLIGKIVNRESWTHI